MKGADSQYLKKYVVEAIIPILIGTVFGVFLLKREWTKLKLHISVRGKEKEIIIFFPQHITSTWQIYFLC